MKLNKKDGTRGPNLTHLLLVLTILAAVGSGCANGSKQFNPTPTSFSTPTIQELISGFNSQDPNERMHAANGTIFYSDHSEAEKAQLIPYLVKTLNGPNDDDRKNTHAVAADFIGALGVYDEQAIEILISWVNEFNHGIEAEVQAIQTLEVFAEHAQDAVPGLIRALTFPSPHLQIAGTNTLGAIGDPVAIPYMLSVILSPNEPFLRREVGLSLAEYGPEARCAIPYLAPVLSDPDMEIAFGAAAVINQAAGHNFVYNGFEDRLVRMIRKWWQETGQYETWPRCPDGLDGERVALPIYVPSTMK